MGLVTKARQASRGIRPLDSLIGGAVEPVGARVMLYRLRKWGTFGARAQSRLSSALEFWWSFSWSAGGAGEGNRTLIISLEG